MRLTRIQEGITPNYAYFPILIDEAAFGASRDHVRSKLLEHNIYARKYFYPPTNSFGCYKGRFNPEDTPTALKLSSMVLTLPVYGGLSAEEVERICLVIKTFPKKNSAIQLTAATACDNISNGSRTEGF